jgi:putative ABC transport system ATP-binding protein
MQRLNQEKNVTFVFSTHDPRITQNANRVVYIEDGRIVEHNPMLS